jgi:SAM-dependent methyltransferase
LNSDLYDHPALYDALLPATAHVSYYLDLARQASGDVLELACGTGQLTAPIASAGLPAVGLDLSAPMLAAARQRAAAAKASMEYVLGDMRNFDLGRKFALIFIARNSLLHLHSTEDILAAFAAVRRHLAPGGIFAFDVFNPNVRLLARPSGERFPVFEVETESFGKLSVEETIDYDAATQVGRGRWYISAAGNPDAWVLPLELRNIFPQELPLLLAAGGFHSRVAWEIYPKRRSIPPAAFRYASVRQQLERLRTPEANNAF